MSYIHMNKAFQIQIPPSARFVLLVLARYANSDDDTCYPGIKKMSELTGYCEKTVVRSIKLLNTLGIIDVMKNPKRPNNTHTVNLTGDIESWNIYLESKADVIKGICRENQSKSVTPKSIYDNSLTLSLTVTTRFSWF